MPKTTSAGESSVWSWDDGTPLEFDDETGAPLPPVPPASEVPDEPGAEPVPADEPPAQPGAEPVPADEPPAQPVPADEPTSSEPVPADEPPAQPVDEPVDEPVDGPAPFTF